jgi:hypothetical protein
MADDRAYSRGRRKRTFSCQLRMRRSRYDRAHIFFCGVISDRVFRFSLVGLSLCLLFIPSLLRYVSRLAIVQRQFINGSKSETLRWPLRLARPPARHCRCCCGDPAQLRMQLAYPVADWRDKSIYRIRQQRRCIIVNDDSALSNVTIGGNHFRDRTRTLK